MHKVIFAVALFVAACTPVLANDCPGVPNGAGGGPNQPQNIVCTNVDANHETISWTNPVAGSCMVQISQLPPGVTAVNTDFHRWYPSVPGSLSTSCSVTVPNLAPSICLSGTGTTQGTCPPIGTTPQWQPSVYEFNPVTCNHTGTPTLGDPNCSSNPWPNQFWWQTALFTMPALSSGTPTLYGYTWGAQNVYGGTSPQSQLFIQTSFFPTAGTFNTNNTVRVTVLNLDTTNNCLPAGLLGGTCEGATVVAACGGNEVLSPSTNNYHVTLAGGQYSCSGIPVINTVSGVVYILYPGTLSAGSHTLNWTVQPYSGGSPVGSTVSGSWTFTVDPAASFTITPPSSYPAIPNLGSWTALEATWGTTNCNNWKIGNQNGIFANDNSSNAQTTNPALGAWNYNGIGVWEQIKDDMNAGSPPTWTTGPKTIGTRIVDSNGNIEVVTGPGAAGGSAPAWNVTVNAAGNTAGNTTTDGAVTWTNVSTPAYWNSCVESLLEQWLNWMTAGVFKSGIDMEYNRFYNGVYTAAVLRQGDVLPESKTGLGVKALTYASELFVTGITNQNIGDGSQRSIFPGTFRNLPYGLESMTLGCSPEKTGSNATSLACLTGTEVMKRVNLCLNAFNVYRTQSQLDGGTSTPAPPFSAPNFDIGLGLEALIEWDNMVRRVGGSGDPRVPVEIGKILDWFYSTHFNLSGTDNTFPYQPYQLLNSNALNPNYNANSQLNNLIAPGFAYYFGMCGNCTLPLSGVTAQVAGDNVFNATLQVTPFDQKSLNEMVKWKADYVGWRSGAYPPTNDEYDPTRNPFEGTYADTAPPFNNPCGPACGGYPVNSPTVTAITSTGATWQWNSFKQITTPTVHVGTSSTNCSAVTITGGTSVFVAGSDSLYLNTVTGSGVLTPATPAYFYKVGGTDAGGNVANSPCASGSFLGNSFTDPFASFATLSGVTITVSSTPNPLLPATVATGYSAAITASGGTGPYTFTVTGGSLPLGLSLSSGGAISGTPSAICGCVFIVKAVDSLLNFGFGTFHITTNPAVTSGHIHQGMIDNGMVVQ